MFDGLSLDAIRGPWPWFVAGPLIGLMVPLLRLTTGKSFGISSSLQHLCAAAGRSESDYLCYDWRKVGGWNLVFVFGVLVGAAAAAIFLGGADQVVVTEGTREQLAVMGVSVIGLVPAELFGLASVRSVVLLLGGGFLVGFGARYAGGCTSGHAITGLADLQLPSLIAVTGFFVGGLVATHVLLPILMGG